MTVYRRFPTSKAAPWKANFLPSPLPSLHSKVHCYSVIHQHSKHTFCLPSSHARVSVLRSRPYSGPSTCNLIGCSKPRAAQSPHTNSTKRTVETWEAKKTVHSGPSDLCHFVPPHCLQGCGAAGGPQRDGRGREPSWRPDSQQEYMHGQSKRGKLGMHCVRPFILHKHASTERVHKCYHQIGRAHV